MIKNILKSKPHRNQFLKFVSVGFVITVMNYVVGVVFVDLFKFKFYIIGLMMIFINIIMRYYFEIKYVYKDGMVK